MSNRGLCLPYLIFLKTSLTFEWLNNKFEWNLICSDFWQEKIKFLANRSICVWTSIVAYDLSKYNCNGVHFLNNSSNNQNSINHYHTKSRMAKISDQNSSLNPRLSKLLISFLYFCHINSRHLSSLSQYASDIWTINTSFNSDIYSKLLRESGKTSELLFHIIATELTTVGG